jgi:hypothetical protein
MNANELRIGNWVLYPHTQLEPFRIEYPRQIELAGIVQPIPLTPEILEAAGFEKDSPEGWYTIQPNPWSQKMQIFFPAGDVPHYADGAFSPNVQYLHQLQNLYFSLTGTELKVSLTEKVNV